MANLHNNQRINRKLTSKEKAVLKEQERRKIQPLLFDEHFTDFEIIGGGMEQDPDTFVELSF